MAITRFNSGAITSSGSFQIPNPDWETIPGMSGNSVAPATGSWYHPAEHFSRTVQHGYCSVHFECVETTYAWEGAEWTRTSGAEDPPGYPDALGTLSDAECAIAEVRNYQCTASAGSFSATSSEGIGHWIGVWTKSGESCFPSPMGASSITVYGEHVSIDDVLWSIDHGSIPLVEVITEETTEARAHATCVHQLRNSYSWSGDVTVTAACENAFAWDTVSYSSIGLPAFSATMTYGAGQEYAGVVPMQVCPDQSICVQARVYSRPAEWAGITWHLSDQYPGGLRAYGREVDYVDEYYEDEVLVYTFSENNMTGIVSSAPAPETCCVPLPAMGVSAVHSEWINAETSIGLDLVACDQMTAMHPIDGLIAHATHFIDQTVEWDEDQQKYVQSETYNTPLDLVVPGSYAVSFQKTSRYDDRNVPNSENDIITVTLTDDSLEELHLPTADNVMVMHDRALDAIGIDTDDWGEHDEHGGAYHGLICLWAQSPLSVQWPQDTRGDGAPPSWWYDSYSHIVLPRQNVTELVLEDPPVGLIARRDLAWHPTRRNAEWMGPAQPGTPEEDLWMHIGNWDRVSATKHLLKGTVIGGPFPMTEENVVCDEDEPAHHTAYGIMPWSEDVTDWRLYEFLRFDVTSSYTVPWTLSVKVFYEYDEVTDNYMMNSEERREGFYVDTSGGTVTYVATVPANASHALVDIDLMRVGAPRLERVRSIEISGMPDCSGTTIIHDIQLLAPQSGVWIESTDVRPMRYGGEPEYTCGTSEFLGIARMPEEYGGWWAVGGHDIARGVRNPGRTVSVAPDWGMPFVIRRVSECGALQDELMDFGAWHGQRIGDWGLEGLYGQIHNTIEGYMSGSAMDSWIDENEVALGLAGGTGWITHVPHLMHYIVASQDLLSSGRNQDGMTDVPVIVRTGALRPAGGMNWAGSSKGDAPVFGARSILYGGRLAHLWSGSAIARVRAGEGVTAELDELIDAAWYRDVCDALTDADGRVRFTRGVQEFKHDESGDETSPDATRSRFTGRIEGEGGNGFNHYQAIPTWHMVRIELEPGYTRTSMTRALGDGAVMLVWTEPVYRQIMYRISPDSCETWLPETYLCDGTDASVTRGNDGQVTLVYVYDGDVYGKLWTGKEWSEAELLINGVDAVDHEACSGLGAHYVAALTWGNNTLQCYGLWYYEDRWSTKLLGTIATDADDKSVPSIRVTATGYLSCAYIAGGNIVTVLSKDGGQTWA